MTRSALSTINRCDVESSAFIAVVEAAQSQLLCFTESEAESVTRDRIRVLKSFIDDAGWRSNLLSQRGLLSAPFGDLREILSATPSHLLILCKDKNYFSAGKDVIRRYSLSYSDAVAFHLAVEDGESFNPKELSEYNALRPVDQTVALLDARMMCRNKSFESLELELDKLVSKFEDYSEENGETWKTCVRVRERIKAITQLEADSGGCRPLCDILQGRPSELSSAAGPGPVTESFLKAATRLKQALETTSSGQRQFLTGVLHNLSKALKAIDTEGLRYDDAQCLFLYYLLLKHNICIRIHTGTRCKGCSPLVAKGWTFQICSGRDSP